MSMSTAAVPKAIEMGTMEIGLTVNGTLRHVDLDPRTSLLDALREHLHLTGTKKGCGQPTLGPRSPRCPGSGRSSSAAAPTCST